jgi:hypothetical protein
MVMRQNPRNSGLKGIAEIMIEMIREAKRI